MHAAAGKWAVFGVNLGHPSVTEFFVVVRERRTLPKLSLLWRGLVICWSYVKNCIYEVEHMRDKIFPVSGPLGDPPYWSPKVEVLDAPLGGRPHACRYQTTHHVATC